MGYRSIKKVLGETSLERKCRLLFGVCLLLLIFGAFYLVYQRAKDLIEGNTRSKGSDLVVMLLHRIHYVRLQSTPVTGATPLPADYLETLSSFFGGDHDFQHEILALDNSSVLFDVHPKLPSDEDERQLLLNLKAKWEQQLNETAANTVTNKLDELASQGTEVPEPIRPVVSEGRRVTNKADVDEYHYYEPIVVRARCQNCHRTIESAGAIAASDPASQQMATPPFQVIKVIIPYAATQNAIDWVRAILIATALATVVVSMFALYVIVRYVIVKPLQHLRGVSDEISRGNLETRADIHTGDEFQELADSFNRMLRHLTDTQADLRKLNSELDFKVDELAQLNMRLYEMNRLKGDFLANMSHELRTPLNSIIGFSEVLQSIDSLTDKQKRYAQNIQKSGRVLLEMINDILDLAKVEAGKMEIRPTEFSIEAIVNAQCDMVRSLTEEKNIDLTAWIEPNLPVVFQDQGKVQQILTNLLSNAIKFTPEGGRITVTAKPDGSARLELTVADTGVGIAPGDREIIFEKFRQGTSVVGEDGLTRKYSGTGLGLSIVRELCRLMGGEISVESEVGKGSTFRVVLPWNRTESVRGDASFQSKVEDMTKGRWNPPSTTPVPMMGAHQL